VDSSGRTIFVADAHRDGGKRYVVHADEKLTAFLELERVTQGGGKVSAALFIVHRLATAPMRRSHSPRLPRKPSSQAVLKLSRAFISRRFPLLVSFDVPIIATRNEDVGRERVVFGFHCHKLRINIMYRRSESFQCLLKACRTHDCSIEHTDY